MNKEIYVYKGREYQAADVKEVIQLHKEWKNSLPTKEEKLEIIQRELKNLLKRLMNSMEPVKYYKLSTLSSRTPIDIYEYTGNTMGNGMGDYIKNTYDGKLTFNLNFFKGTRAIIDFEMNTEISEQDFIERMNNVYETIMDQHAEYKEKFLKVKSENFIIAAEKMKDIYKLIENFKIQ